MDATRFDQITKLFADRRLSRRQALRKGGAGLAAGALAAVGLNRPAAAQDAASPAPAAGDKLMFLFVQAFRSGSIVRKAGAADTYTITLEQGLGHTIYFSDRPARIVGAAPTPKFLAGLGFTPANPPNAALVVEPTPGTTEIAVVELYEPRYDEATFTATYDAKLLANYETTTELGFHEQPGDLAQLAPTFGSAHLLIDDCANGTVTCWAGDAGVVGTFQDHGMCWSLTAFACVPCEPYYHTNPATSDVVAYWIDKCGSTFDCPAGACNAYW